MRLSRSGSNDSRDAAAIARTPRTSEAMAICLLWRRTRDARASRARSNKGCVDNMRRKSSQGIRLAIAILVALAACQRKEPLTAQKAAEIIRGYQFAKEPVYAEVPQR